MEARLREPCPKLWLDRFPHSRSVAPLLIVHFVHFAASVGTSAAGKGDGLVSKTLRVVHVGL